jgi:hypothetical protein
MSGRFVRSSKYRESDSLRLLSRVCAAETDRIRPRLRAADKKGVHGDQPSQWQTYSGAY